MNIMNLDVRIFGFACSFGCAGFDGGTRMQLRPIRVCWRAMQKMKAKTKMELKMKMKMKRPDCPPP